MRMPAISGALHLLGALAVCWTLAACAGDAPPDAGPAGGPPPAEWILPVEDLQWSKAHLLAVFVVAEQADFSSLRLSLNGEDRTEKFLPPGTISITWRERASLAEAGDEGVDMTLGGERRVQAILHHEDFRMGENRLLATFDLPGQGRQECLRRFRFAPEGRLIRCRVTRRARDGDDTAGGARIVLLPVDDAPVPDLSTGSSHPLFRWPNPRRRSFELARNGIAEFYLPRGRYRAIATAGLLDGIDEWEIPEEGEAEHAFVLRREVDLPETTTVDFHVHAGPSPDSLVPLDERIYSYVAGGVQVLVGTDHNIITDYRPLIQRLPGAAGRITSMPGVEAGLRRSTGGSWGHWNLWPLEPDPEAPPARPGQITGYGALDLPGPATARDLVEGLAVPEMYEAYRRRGRALARRAGTESPEVVIQLNHPRGIQFGPRMKSVKLVHDWFNAIDFDPSQPVAGSLLRPAAGGLNAMDFDALEIWNRSSRWLYEEVRADWFALLNQGYIRTGTANTDSHTVSPEIAGHPLNVVFLRPGQPDGARVRPGDLAEAVRAGRVVGTDGPIPLLTVTAQGAGARPGGILPAPGGHVTIRVDVAAASWVPRGEIRLWANGEILARTAEKVLEMEADFDTDTWIVAEAGDLEGVPEGESVPGLYGLLVPRGLAMGFTNPVFVEVDGTRGFGER